MHEQQHLQQSTQARQNHQHYPEQEADLSIFTRLLSKNLSLRNEFILVVGDEGTPTSQASLFLARRFAQAAKTLGKNHKLIVLRKRDIGEEGDELFSEELLKLPQESIIILTLSGKIGTLPQIKKSFRSFCAARRHRFLSASNLQSLPPQNLPAFIKALAADYDAMAKEGALLKEALTRANSVQIKTPAGTDLTMSVRGARAILANATYPEPGTGGNIPGSEVYIAPVENTANGVLVIDGSLRVRRGTILPKAPVTLTIKHGSVTAITGGSAAQELEETLRWAEKRAKYPERIRKVAELGIGLNPLASIVGLTVLDEKARNTAHIAFGSNNWFGGTIKSIIHLDQVIKNPRLLLDGKPLPRFTD